MSGEWLAPLPREPRLISGHGSKYSPVPRQSKDNCGGPTPESAHCRAVFAMVNWRRLRPLARCIKDVFCRLARYCARALRKLARLAGACYSFSPPPRLQALCNSTEVCIHLFADKSSTFSQDIEDFIVRTCESKETNPQVVMRNIRHFMSAMKNYLAKHQFHKQRSSLEATECLNLDSILEGVMYKLVVRPLKEHLYRLLVDEYTRTGAIHLLADNIRYARTKSPQDLGIRPIIVPPSGNALSNIIQILNRLQEVDSPVEKLEHLLSCISAIFNSVKVCNQGGGCVTLGADDFLPLFVWVLVQSGMVAAEIEAEYMWGLLQSSLLSGEGGYYLTTLSGAVHVLKNFTACSEEHHNALGPDCCVGSLADFRSILKIVVPDEVHGSIITKTFPVRPNMTTRDICKIIAHKVRIANPQDFGLFKLVDGEETLLNDSECPENVKGIVAEGGKHCMFAYKRIDAEIAWPTTSSC